MASFFGRFETVRLLLQAGTDKDLAFNQGSDDGATALMAASYAGHVEVVHLLLQVGSDMELTTYINKFTALMMASGPGHVEVVSLLLEAGADMSCQDCLGETALLKASREGRVDVVRLLLDAGADIDVADSLGSTALIEAFLQGHVEVVRMLLEAGADKYAAPNSVDLTEAPAENEAHLDPMQRLLRLNDPVLRIEACGLELGAFVAGSFMVFIGIGVRHFFHSANRKLIRCVFLREAVSETPTSQMEEFMQPARSAWNSRPCRGNALHRAALENDLEAAEERFSYETEFRGQKQEGSGEAIHLAASRGNVELVKRFGCHLGIRVGISLVRLETRGDHKPHYNVLHAALFAEGRGGTKEMIEYLFDARAELSRNQDGKAPIHIAFQTGIVPVIKLVRSLMVKSKVTDRDYEFFQAYGWVMCYFLNMNEDVLNLDDVPFPLELGCKGPQLPMQNLPTAKILHPTSFTQLSVWTSYNEDVTMFHSGKMSEFDLSEAAELTLTRFSALFACPQCLPSFLERMKNETEDELIDIGKSIKISDIAKVLREAPEAATALLRYVRGVWWLQLLSHSVWLTSSGLAKFKRAFNPQAFAKRANIIINNNNILIINIVIVIDTSVIIDVYLTEYQHENNWSFDPSAWRPPGPDRDLDREPNASLISLARAGWVTVQYGGLNDKQQSDATPTVEREQLRFGMQSMDFKPDRFAALVDPKNADFLQLYEDDTIHAMVKHLFWKAAGKIDLTSVPRGWGLFYRPCGWFGLVTGMVEN
ncbi:Ankyrin repeat domain-containing protein 29 [Symbiodinium microadriaticum]|uniref:Ankyrin repeat domain-containing protein 29 n=1 Tax=Symbiodinium microadriaticum TaxID=2951 RepID=A0A1Q9DSN9_SYMMI|nr:Ankyrin repeat domain-containing protein 29 [Symbiodinium microadriaticum]